MTTTAVAMKKPKLMATDIKITAKRLDKLKKKPEKKPRGHQ